MRELLKSELYVKVVPAQCIVNGIISQSVSGRGINVFDALQADASSAVNEILPFLKDASQSSEDDLRRFARLVGNQELGWSDILKIWDFWYRGILDGSIKRGSKTTYFRDVLTVRSGIMNFSRIREPFTRAYGANESYSKALMELASGGIAFADVSDSFIKSNVAWTTTSASLDFAALPVTEDNLSAADLMLGGRVTAELAATESDLPEAFKAELRNLSIVYLASGLARVGVSPESVRPQQIVESYAFLARSVDAKWMPDGGRSTLGTELARVAADRIGLLGSEELVSESAQGIIAAYRNSVTLPELPETNWFEPLKYGPNCDPCLTGNATFNPSELTIQFPPEGGIVATLDMYYIIRPDSPVFATAGLDSIHPSDSVAALSWPDGSNRIYPKGLEYTESGILVDLGVSPERSLLDDPSVAVVLMPDQPPFELNPRVDFPQPFLTSDDSVIVVRNCDGELERDDFRLNHILSS